MREFHPKAADHLEQHINCGKFLEYDSDGVDWVF
jgi:hypothetical protein